MTKGKDNAFPQNFAQAAEFGLTKREYMATHILAGMYAQSGTSYDLDRVEKAAKIADILIAELNK